MSVARLPLSFSIGLATCFATPVFAHHSFNMFDMERLITIEGRVTGFKHVNPHGYITMEVTDANGETAIWEIETVSAMMLNRRGITPDTLEPGEWIRVEANPARNPERRFANGDMIHKGDGTELVLVFDPERPGFAEPDPAPIAVASSLEGIWRGGTAFFDVLLPDVLAGWPLTDKARASLAEYDGSQNPWTNCVPYSPPVINLAPLDFGIEIADDEVTMFLVPDQPYRRVFMNQTAHPADIERTNEGHSIGRWEGDTLVIDTVSFTARELGHAFGIPSGAGKHLIERLTLAEDGTHFTYEYEVEDPEYLTGKVTGTNRFDYRPDLTLVLGDCDMEAARRYLEIY